MRLPVNDADARRLLAGIVLIAAATFGLVAPVAAQDVPEGQSCGGLVCDLGLFGHKTGPKPAVAAPGPAVVAPIPVPQRAAATSEPEPKRSARKKTHVAKANKPARIAPPVSAAVLEPVASAMAPSSLVPASIAPAPAATQPMALAPAPFVPASIAPAPVPVTAPPAAEAPVVLINPYVYTKPLNFMFQSVDPTQATQ